MTRFMFVIVSEAKNLLFIAIRKVDTLNFSLR